MPNERQADITIRKAIEEMVQLNQEQPYTYDREALIVMLDEALAGMFATTFPITILTLGLFLLVVNAAMLGLVAWMLDGFVLGGFGPALLGAIIVSLTGWVGSWFIGPRGRVEVMVVRGQR